jgi:succinyl-diaminopimelate desuccinylase
MSSEIPHSADVLALACELIRRPSLTPDDAGCQALIGARLAAAGFAIESLRIGEVDNLWATFGDADAGPTCVLLGHTDVVPTGPVADWQSDPFQPSLRDGYLYGRGAADMKGSVAAFVCALEQFAAAHPTPAGRVALLLTSDEEGPSIDGVRAVAERFRARGERIDHCLVGEPSSQQQLGDQVRIGRRGSLTGTAMVHGVQGHVAYAELARNPIHAVLPALLELAGRDWDGGPVPDFPATGFQIANFNAGTGASNVIPGRAWLQFNLRYSPRWSAAELIAEVDACFARHEIPVEIDWQANGEPFHTGEGPLRQAVRDSVHALRGIWPAENTGGGTSDGRFVAPLGADVVELGPVNATIHKIDERIALAELQALPALYLNVLQRLLVGRPPSPPG